MDVGRFADWHVTHPTVAPGFSTEPLARVNCETAQESAREKRDQAQNSPVGQGARQRRDSQAVMRSNVVPLTVGHFQISRALCKFGAALSAALLVLALHAGAADLPEGVLVIHSNQRPTPAAIIIEDTLRKAVPDGLKRPVEIYSEYLDIERFPVDAYAGAGAEFLRQKYTDRNIRVIVASAPQAVQFATKFRERIAPGVPVVHVAMPRDQLERMSLPPDVIGKSIDLDPKETLELAFRLHPDAKRLVVVVGAAERDRIWEQRVRAAVARLETPIAVEYLSGLPTPDVLRRLKP